MLRSHKKNLSQAKYVGNQRSYLEAVWKCARSPFETTDNDLVKCENSVSGGWHRTASCMWHKSGESMEDRDTREEVKIWLSHPMIHCLFQSLFKINCIPLSYTHCWRKWDKLKNLVEEMFWQVAFWLQGTPRSLKVLVPEGLPWGNKKHANLSTKQELRGLLNIQIPSVCVLSVK